VGTLQLQLQQAGVMQQPFSKAVASLIRQVHQHGAQVGKEHYATFPWILSQMSGDEGMEAIIASKEMQKSWSLYLRIIFF
jgi:protein-disulfide isomerase